MVGSVLVGVGGNGAGRPLRGRWWHSQLRLEAQVPETKHETSALRNDDSSLHELHLLLTAHRMYRLAFNYTWFNAFCGLKLL